MKYVIAILMLAISSLFIPEIVDEYMLGKAQLEAESYCVNILIAKGVERIDIATANGKCWKETNGYYK